MLLETATHVLQMLNYTMYWWRLAARAE